MNKKVKSFLLNFIGFAFFFSLIYFLVVTFAKGVTGLWIPIISGVAASILSPKFQVVKYMGEDKIFMSWMFIKGVKEIK
jgi:hypothetical protein